MPNTTELVSQPSHKPVRKVRVAGFVLSALTIGVYIFGAIEGNEVVNEDAFFDATRVLISGGLPLITAYFAKAEASEAGEQ